MAHPRRHGSGPHRPRRPQPLRHAAAQRRAAVPGRRPGDRPRHRPGPGRNRRHRHRRLPAPAGGRLPARRHRPAGHAGAGRLLCDRRARRPRGPHHRRGDRARLDADPPTDETAVVVVLGTNDLAHGATRAELDRRIDDLLAATAGRPTVWATSAATGLATDAGTLTAALTAAQGRHAHLLVADWAAYLDGLPAAPPGPTGPATASTTRPRATRSWPTGWPASSPPPGSRPSTPRPATVGSARCCSTPRCSPGSRSRPPRACSARSTSWPPRWPAPPSGPGPEGADDARASRFAEEFLPASEEFWHEVVAAAPVVAGDSACLQPDPSMPVPQIIEVVWRCEMLRTPPTLWTPDGTVDGADAQDRLLGEAHVVAATWSDRGAAPCDEAAPYAGVFPLPALAARHPVRPRAEHPHRRPAGPRPGEPPPRPAAGRHRVGAGRRGLGHHGAGPR